MMKALNEAGEYKEKRGIMKRQHLTIILCGIEIGEISMVDVGAVVTKNVLSKAVVFCNTTTMHRYLESSE